MPDLLGPTNPVPGYDSAGHRATPITPNDASIQNIVDPTRVVRSDGRSDKKGAGNDLDPSSTRYDSNFQTFIQRLRDTPGLTESFADLFLRQGTLASSGMSEGMAAEMSQFLEMLQMDEGELLAFIMNQMKSGARFGGALFSVLLKAYSGTQSEVLKNDILQFLKKFSDFSSSTHLEGNILRNLTDMAHSLPASWADKLISLTGQLANGVAAGDRQGNLQLLRGQILPLISEYVGRTHDLGRARELLSRLTLDMVRYDNGSEEGLLQAFRQLTGYGVLRHDLGDVSDEALLRLLRETEFNKAAQNNQFADNLAQIASRALRGEGGTSMQDAFRNIVAAFLLNESVYMPVSHIVIPMEMNDRGMFSEMWVDPDAENKSDGGQSEGRTTRILLKMDIEEIGLFDVLINSRGERVALQVACPARIAEYSEVMSRALSDILISNGLTPEAVNVAAMKRPLVISEVFPKIYERKNSVNVKV